MISFFIILILNFINDQSLPVTLAMIIKLTIVIISFICTFLIPRYFNIIHFFSYLIVLGIYVIGLNEGVVENMTEFRNHLVKVAGIEKASYYAGLFILFGL